MGGRVNLSSQAESDLATVVRFTTDEEQPNSFFSKSLSPSISEGFQRSIVKVRLHAPVKFLRDLDQGHNLADQQGIGHFQHGKLLKSAYLAAQVLQSGAASSSRLRAADFFFKHPRKIRNLIEKNFRDLKLALFVCGGIAPLRFDLPLVLRICDSVGAKDRDDCANSLHPRGPLSTIEALQKACYDEANSYQNCAEYLHISICKESFKRFHKGIIA